MNLREEGWLLRSLLFVPGHRERYIDSAIKSDADVLLLDVEDSVPLSDKPAARELVKRKVKSGMFGNREVAIRVNSRESNLLDDDLEATIWTGVSGIMVPKVKNADDVLYFDSKLAAIEKTRYLPSGRLYIIPLIENPSAVLNAYSIATASPRVIAIAFGSEDFIAELQGKHVESGSSIFTPRAIIAMAARAANCEPIDTVYLNIKDLEGFTKQVQLGRELGFSGALVLHPIQLEVAHKYFTPSQEEIEEARKILAVVQDAQEAGYGVTLMNGELVGPPMVIRSKKVMAMVEKINNRRWKPKTDSEKR